MIPVAVIVSNPAPTVVIFKLPVTNVHLVKSILVRSKPSKKSKTASPLFIIWEELQRLAALLLPFENVPPLVIFVVYEKTYSVPIRVTAPLNALNCGLSVI